MAALAMASFCSCESESLDALNKESEEFTEVPIMITKSDSEMIEAGNEFAFNLLEAICNDEKHRNQDIVISRLVSVSFWGLLTMVPEAGQESRYARFLGMTVPAYQKSTLFQGKLCRVAGWSTTR